MIYFDLTGLGEASQRTFFSYNLWSMRMIVEARNNAAYTKVEEDLDEVIEKSSITSSVWLRGSFLDDADTTGSYIDTSKHQNYSEYTNLRIQARYDYPHYLLEDVQPVSEVQSCQTVHV